MVQGMAISYTQEISDMKLTAFWGYNPPTQKDGGGGVQVENYILCHSKNGNQQHVT